MALESRLLRAGWDALSASVFRELIESKPGGVAVFDADGTLWEGDCGEDLFRALSSSGLLAGPETLESAIEKYRILEGQDTTLAYGWIVQQMAGVLVDEAQKTSRELMTDFVAEEGFPPMLELARAFEDSGWQTWIVSASASVVVRAGARVAGLDPARVLAVELDIREETYQNELLQVPNLEGKPEAIRLAGLKPDFAAGNSVNDIPMLRMASKLVLCVNPCDALYAESVEQNWMCAAIQRPLLELVQPTDSATKSG